MKIRQPHYGRNFPDGEAFFTLLPAWILIPGSLTDKCWAPTHRGDGSGMLGLELSGGIFEATLELGMSKEQPLRPHKGKSLNLISMLSCTGQSSSSGCHVTCLLCSLCLCVLYCISLALPLCGASQKLRSSTASCDLCIHQPGSGALKPWSQECVQASESFLF